LKLLKTLVRPSSVTAVQTQFLLISDKAHGATMHRLIVHYNV